MYNYQSVDSLLLSRMHVPLNSVVYKQICEDRGFQQAGQESNSWNLVLKSRGLIRSGISWACFKLLGMILCGFELPDFRFGNWMR